MNPGVLIAILLVVTWAAQALLSMRQMRRYFRRVNALRREGRVATGAGGGRYRGRVYGVLAVDLNAPHIIKSAEQLAGWTVFADLKPVPQLVGLPLDTLLDDPTALAAFKPKEADAFRAAAKTLRDSFRTPAESGEASTSAASDQKGTPATPAKGLAGRPATATVKE